MDANLSFPSTCWKFEVYYYCYHLNTIKNVIAQPHSSAILSTGRMIFSPCFRICFSFRLNRQLIIIFYVTRAEIALQICTFSIRIHFSQ